MILMVWCMLCWFVCVLFDGCYYVLLFVFDLVLLVIGVIAGCLLMCLL